MARKQAQKKKPSPNKRKDAVQSELQVSGLVLYSLQFVPLGPSENMEDLDWDVSLGTAYMPPTSLGVEMSTVVRCENAFEVTITYRVTFNRMKPFSDDEDQEGFWRSIVAFAAPVVLMPYIRATFSWLVAQAGIPGILLPLINPQQIISPDEVVLPSPVKQRG